MNESWTISLSLYVFLHHNIQIDSSNKVLKVPGQWNFWGHVQLYGTK